MRFSGPAACSRAPWALALAVALPALGAAQVPRHVAVIHVDPAVYSVPTSGPRAIAAQAFYATHRDAYDFLVLFPAFPIDLSQQGPGEVAGKHWPVRNGVSGTGMGSYDLGASFGSVARLKSVIDVHSLVPGIAVPGFDAALGIVAHEVAHQWSGAITFRDSRTGKASGALLGLDAAHWSAFLYPAPGRR